MSFNLYKTLNEIENAVNTGLVRTLDLIVATRRQVYFEILRSNNCKIGMNTNENKLYHISKLNKLDPLNLPFKAFKRHMKIQFLKFGHT